MPYITEDQARRIRATRELDETSRKRRKAAIFAEIKREHGISSSAKISFEIDNPGSAKYLRINDAVTKMEYVVPGRAPMREAPPAPTLKPAAQWPFPNAERKTAEGLLYDAALVVAMPKPAIAGINRVAPERVAPTPVGAPELLLGSIELDDLVSLLRVEADSRDTFQKKHGQATAAAFVEGNRLYFVL